MLPFRLALICSIFGLPPSQVELYEIVKDAMSTNAAHYKSGVMTVRVEQAFGERRPVEMETTVAWKDRDAFWVYRLSDPDLIVVRENHTAPLAEAATEYRLLMGDRLYAYNPFINTLSIHAVKNNRDRVTAFDMIDVLPAELWTHCCPPHPSEGRLWLEMIGPKSPGIRPGATIRIERIDPGTIKQTRIDPGGGIAEIVFSLSAGYNVTSHQYTDPKSHRVTYSGIYEWSTGPNGTYVLKRCELRKAKEQGGSVLSPGRYLYTATVKSVDLGVRVDSSRLSFDALSKYLPRNTRIIDDVKKQSYPLFRDNAQIEADLAPLKEEVRSRGFQKKGR